MEVILLIKDLAPYSSACIGKDSIRKLDELRNEIQQRMESGFVFGYINHSISHSDNVLKIIDKLLLMRKIQPTEVEAIIFIAICYYHDIGHFLNKTTHSHSIESAEFVMSGTLFSINVMNLIAKICSIHDNMSELLKLELAENVSGELVRVKLFSLLFALAESLDLGKERTTSPIEPEISFKNRLFWYRNYCIKEVFIQHKITVVFENNFVGRL